MKNHCGSPRLPLVDFLMVRNRLCESLAMKKKSFILFIVALLAAIALPVDVFSHEPEFSETSHETDKATYKKNRGPSVPVYENILETQNFILKWTNRSRNPKDNISDSSIIHETAGYLETAWSEYYRTFGRTPYLPQGKSKMEIHFRDLDCFGEADPPDGPIKFDSKSWVKRPGIRQPTSAHELFHKLQYAFGYRTKWAPKRPYKWFSEGTAAWAEVYVWQRVSGSHKMRELFEKPNMKLYDSNECSLPFWIYFQARCQTTGDSNPMLEFFKHYEATGNEKAALAHVISKHQNVQRVDHQINSFFAQFARERQTGSWCLTPSGQEIYSKILGPKGNNIVPELNVTEIPMSRGANYRNSGAIPLLSSGYYRFKFAENSDGGTLKLSLNAAANSGGEPLYFLGWERNGKWDSDVSSLELNGDHDISERIDLVKADSLVLIISGGESGGSYTVKASLE
jgi:hypothetical protein